MSDRSASLAALRPSRSTALPPPPTLPPPRDTREDPQVPDRGRRTDPPQAEAPAERPPADETPAVRTTGVDAPAAGRRASSPAAKDDPAASSADARAATPIRSGFDRLVTDPVDACRTMGMLREGQPSKPLNVDLTPGVASRFDDRCRTLRLKKKDVVELLLRAWLEQADA